jgi:hypothetical protein
LERGQQLTAQYLNDSNFEKFINAEAKRLSYSCSYKATGAALNWYLQMMAMPTISKTSNSYPLAHLALRGWKRQYSEIGKLPRQAQGFSTEAISFVMKTPIQDDNKILLYKVLFVVMIWNAYRSDDADNLLATGVTKNRATNLVMRNYENRKSNRPFFSSHLITNHVRFWSLSRPTCCSVASF